MPESPVSGLQPPPLNIIDAQVRIALDEDVGSGDLTAALLPPEQHAQVEVVSREDAVLCGQPWFERVFGQLDERIRVSWDVLDGQRVGAGERLCRASGPIRALLTGERTALNYLQTLSATATKARRYADAVSGLAVRILDTRKTLPGLRIQQKYAVRAGGCFNHRMGLYDAVLIKENHILAAGSVAAAVHAVRGGAPRVRVEVEVETMDELREALNAGADNLLLDNFGIAEMRKAVEVTAGRARLEASGGIALDRIRQVAETGVDDISVGALTKDVQALDLSMRFVGRS